MRKSAATKYWLLAAALCAVLSGPAVERVGAADEDAHHHQHAEEHGDEHAGHDAHEHGKAKGGGTHKAGEPEKSRKHDEHGHGEHGHDAHGHDEHGHDEHGHDEHQENQTTLSPDALKAANVVIDVAGPEIIENSTHVYGKILPDEDQVAHITPRFAGVIRDIRKRLGDTVEKGEVIAVVESNQSLQPYEIRSQVAGTVVKRHATVGENVTESQEIFVIVNLSQVWADFQLYRDDFEAISVGQEILINLGGGKEPLRAKVSYVSPLTDEVTQAKLIRAVLPNEGNQLRPGLFVSGSLIASAASVPVAVKRSAVQTHGNTEVVYVTDGKVFRAAPVALGRKDSEHVEVLSGIKAGELYVSENSYIIKADIGKAEAGHDHAH